MEISFFPRWPFVQFFFYKFRTTPGAIYFPSPRSRPPLPRTLVSEGKGAAIISPLFASNALKVGHPTPTFVLSLRN